MVADAINGIKGKKIDGVTVTYYDGDFGQQNTAFVGIGYEPLAGATNFLGSISDEQQYMFINPMINTKLSQTGKAFDPFQAEPVYNKGVLGKYGECEVRANKYMPLVFIKQDLVTDIANTTAVAYAESSHPVAVLYMLRRCVGFSWAKP